MRNIISWGWNGSQSYYKMKKWDAWTATHKRYGKHELVSAEYGNREIRKLLQSNSSIMVGRLGFSELAAMRNFAFNRRKNLANNIKQLCEWSGFFPNDVNLGKCFLGVMEESLQNCDLLCASGQPFEEYFVKKFLPHEAKVTSSFRSLEAWRYPEEPWSGALQNRKVLLILPFEESAKRQYQKRDKLFIGTDILPEFQLLTYKPLVTLGLMDDSRFRNWFDALAYMEDEISNIDFDIAILGCGAYGFPLAARIKKMGKKAVHMGGVTQILFGIMGRRWDGTRWSKEINVDTVLKPYYNEHWTYPLREEKPEAAGKVEYGPYWR